MDEKNRHVTDILQTLSTNTAASKTNINQSNRRWFVEDDGTPRHNRRKLSSGNETAGTICIQTVLVRSSQTSRKPGVKLLFLLRFPK